MSNPLMQLPRSVPQESLAAILDSAPIGVVLLGADESVRWANAELSRILGWDDDVGGRRLSDLLDGDRASQGTTLLQQVRAAGGAGLETWCRRKDGTRVALAISAGSLHDAFGQDYCLVRDITDQLRSREEYAHAVSLYDATLESTADGLLVVGQDGRASSYNRRFLDLWRIPESVAESGSDTDLLAYALEQVEDPAKFLQRVDQLYADPDQASYDEIRFKDGRVFERYSQPQRIGGTVVGRVWSFRDVTERRRAEAALLESRHLLELFFAQSLDGFFFMMLEQPVRWDDTVDKDAVLDHVFEHERITKVNDAMLAQYGARREDLLGRTPAMLFAHDPAGGKAVWREFFDAGRLHNETHERKVDGTPIWIEGDYICLYDAVGRIVGHFGIQRDITERKRADEALRFSEDKFAKAFRSSPLRVSITTLADGRFVEVNDTFLHDHGLTRAQVIGRTAEELGLLADPADRRELIDALEREGVVRDFEVAGKLRDGRAQVISLSAEVIQVGGEPCVLAVGADVTARKEAEEKARRSRRELRALAARLESVREEERTRIAREIHDELGQALTGLKIDLAWLKRRVDDRPESLERVQSILGRIDGTIDSVRRIATELRPSVLDHLGLVAAVEWQAQEFERRTGIMTTVKVQSDHPALDDARATTVFRILQETLTNVARHARATRVTISLIITAADLALDVKDNGRGITDAEIAAPRSLGLVGLRERAIACGGTLTIRGEPDRGTHVAVRIRLIGTPHPPRSR